MPRTVDDFGGGIGEASLSGLLDPGDLRVEPVKAILPQPELGAMVVACPGVEVNENSPVFDGCKEVLKIEAFKDADLTVVRTRARSPF